MECLGLDLRINRKHQDKYTVVVKRVGRSSFTIQRKEEVQFSFLSVRWSIEKSEDLSKSMNASV